MGAIGVFDSGIGGLSVLKVLRHSLPQESFVYFADGAYRPYGEKTEDQIRSRSQSIIQWLIQRGVKLIVVACHTSSAVLDDLSLTIPVITMISPSLESVFSRSFTKGLGVIATALTASKGTLVNQLTQRGFSYPIHVYACPELVPLIEDQQWLQAQDSMNHSLTLVRNLCVDYILYGCTHYPLLDSFLDQEVRGLMIDPAEHVTHLIQTSLSQGKLAPNTPHNEQGQLTLYHTGAPHALTPHLSRLGWQWQEMKAITLPAF